MRKSNWSVKVAIAGAAILLLFVVYGSGFYAGALLGPDSDLAAYSDQPSPSTEMIDERAADEDPNYYLREDLIAQRAMATWTRFMGLAALVSVPFSIIGIFLIWQTWTATREAAAETRVANSQFRNQARAKLVLRDLVFEMPWQKKSDSSWPAQFRLKFDNVGDSAAHKVKTTIVCYLYRKRKRLNRMRSRDFLGTITAHGNHKNTTDLQVAPDDIALLDGDLANKVLVQIQFSFEDIFGDLWEEEYWLISPTRGTKDKGIDHHGTAFRTTDAGYLDRTSLFGQPKKRTRRNKKKAA